MSLADRRRSTPSRPPSKGGAGGLALHTSNRLEILLDDLARRLAEEPLPPLEREVLVVQSLGMERWLRLELARRLGIAGHLEFPFPANLLTVLADRLLDPKAGEGDAGGPITDWRPTAPSLIGREGLGWRLFGLLRDDPGELPRLYLRDDPDQRKRYQLAKRLAGLFDDYLMFRPETVLAWERGETPESGPGLWQAPLWRRLMPIEQGPGPAGGHRAHRFTELLEWLERDDHDPADLLARGLPRRIDVFGVSTLPPLVLRLLAALARWIPVRIYFVSPTYHYWGDLRSEREMARIEQRLRRPEQNLDEEHYTAGHRLLSNLGRQGRDFFNLLQEVDGEGNAWHELEFVEPEGDSVLARLQRDILHLDDLVSGDDPNDDRGKVVRGVIAADDGSLRVHVVHSPMREMEVLRDQLLAAFAEDPELRPDDVLVLLGDIERYSPYIEAVFGSEPAGPGRRGGTEPPLPFAIADRRAGATRPTAEAVGRVLELATARRTLGEVFDLLECPAIRRRFELEAEAVPELRQRLAQAGVRWGEDGAHRRTDFALPPEEANSWRIGLDRLLMGLAVGGIETLVAGVAPLAGDTAGDSQALGQFAAYVDTLFAHLDTLRQRRSAARWARDIGRLLDDLFAPDSEEDEADLQWVRDALDTLRRAETEHGLDEPIDPEVIRRDLADRLADDGGPGPFLTGRITFCALKPMRTIPFAVVWIAGLDDGVFPRRDPPRSFDLVRHQPRLGDRSLRDDDRYLFLETLLAAERRLLLSTVGRSQRDGSERAPSVVLGELLDHLDRCFVGPRGESARQYLVVDHRLHGFHPAYFGAEPDAPLFSYSHRALAAAEALVGPRYEPPPFVSGVDDGASPPEAHGHGVGGGDGGGDSGDSGDDEGDGLEILELDELLRFWVDPCRYYTRNVLGMELTESEGAPEHDAEPFETIGLEGYGVRQWLLDRRLRSLEPGADELALLRARGELPLAGLGEAEYQTLCDRVAVVCSAIPRHPPLPPRSFRLDGDGWRLVGRIDGLTPQGLLRYRCAAIRPADKLRAWIVHLAWNALTSEGDPRATDAPDRRTRLVGEESERRRRDRPRILDYGPVAEAGAHLAALVEGYRRGLREPLPFFPATAAAYAEQARKQDNPRIKVTPLDAASKIFLGVGQPPGGPSWAEADKPWVALCFRGRQPLDHPDLPRWAERLWDALLDHETEQG